MPGVMVASAAVFAPAPPLFEGFALTLPALTAGIPLVRALGLGPYL